MCDFVLFGATGFIGGHILKALQDQKFDVKICSIRLEQAERILEFLESADISPISHGVICAAGVKGTPNMDWCLTHPCETIETNIVGQLNVARACRLLQVHCTFVGSCMVYPPSPKLADDAGIAGGEPSTGYHFYREDEDTLSGADYIDRGPEHVHFYRKARCVLEDLLQYYPNSLNLRVLFPIEMSDKSFENKQSLLGKLRTFSRVEAAVNSVTFLDNLCPTLPKLIAKKTTGNLNFVNPGAVDYVAVVGKMRKKIDGYDPEFSAVGRGNFLLNTDRLVREGSTEEYPVITADQCLDLIFNS